MHDLSDCPSYRNKNLSRRRAKSTWSAEFPLNRREVMRVELTREPGGRSTVDVRRWSMPTSGGNSTAKGVAFDVRHLVAVDGLLRELLRHALDTGLLPTDGGANG
jgi:hypothetical protein